MGRGRKSSDKDDKDVNGGGPGDVADGELGPMFSKKPKVRFSNSSSIRAGLFTPRPASLHPDVELRCPCESELDQGYED